MTAFTFDTLQFPVMAPLPLEQNASAVALVTFVRAFAQVRTLSPFTSFTN